MNKIKKIGLLLFAVVALFALVASPASAKPHHKKHHPKPLTCKPPLHRNGNKCVPVPAGPVGPQGPAGPQGSPGATGPAGSDGAPGTPGAAGKDGSNGSQGEPGPTGPTGPTGPEGPQGEPAPVSLFAYDNIMPESRTDNPVSLGYAATGTTEFGSQIALGNEGGVVNPEVEVLMSVWSCELGEWNSGCITTNNTNTFDAELTLNVYEVGFENSVGASITSVTETFALPFRPSADPTCPSVTQYRASDGKCFNGRPAGVAFDLTGVTLPHKAIVSVEFTPSNTAGDPLNSLNVGLEGPPVIGHNPLDQLEGIYWDSAWFGSGTFGLEEHSEFGPGEQLAARVIK